jgi:glycosyltransferase involved in cell wall biosynthesis
MARNKNIPGRRKAKGLKSRDEQGRKLPRVLALFGEDKPATCALVRVVFPYKYARKKRKYHFDTARHQDAWAAARAGYPLHDYDIYVMPRISDRAGEATGLIASLQAVGKKVVWEVDDDYTNEHRRVIKYDAMAVAAQVDAITVTTPYLRSRYAEACDNIYVLPNCIHFPMFEPFINMRRVRGLTVGIGGTQTHFHDWKVVAEPMRDILAEFPELTFVVMGYMPEYFHDLPSDQVEFIPPLYYLDYPLALRQVDIGLAPLDGTDRFNLSKSGIKALEYWASMRYLQDGRPGGAAAIASDMPVYQRVMRNGIDGLLVENTESAWYAAIRRLVKNHQERMDFAVAGLRRVEKTRDVTKHVGKWINAYRRIYGFTR